MEYPVKMEYQYIYLDMKRSVRERNVMAMKWEGI